MRPMSALQSTPSVTDRPAPEALQALDAGLSGFNAAQPALAQVRPLFVAVHDAGGRLSGAASGRSWGECCELQQLWVDAACRRRGLGRALLAAFEAEAAARGCRLVYLDTFSFQAPGFYAALGYEPALVTRGYAPGIEKTTFHKRLGPAP